MNSKDRINKIKNNSVNQTKICKVCNRPFKNRKRWASRNVWIDVQYCSQKCRRMKNSLLYRKKFKE